MQLDVMAQQQNWVPIMKQQALLQPTHDFPRTSPEGSLSVLMSGTYREPSGDSQGTNTKTDDLMKKMFFRSNSLALHIYSCFLQEEQIFKTWEQIFLNGEVQGTSTGPSCGTSWGTIDGMF